MGTQQNITAEGLLSILGISGYNGIAVAKSGTTATTLVITVTQPAYAMLGDGIILTSELVSTTVEDLSTDGDYRLYLDYEDVYEGRDAVWTVATSAPSPAALLIADVTVAGDTISAVTLLRSTPLPSALTQSVAFTPPPPLSEWTWINQGPYDDSEDFPLLVTAEDIPGGIRFQAPGPTNFPGLILSDGVLPAPPYTITTAFITDYAPNTAEFGIVLYNSETGEGHSYNTFNDEYVSVIQAYDFTATSEVFSYTEGSVVTGPFLLMYDTNWIRIQNDGQIINIYVSILGRSFVQALQLDSSEFTGLDRYGLIFVNYNSSLTESPYPENYYKNASNGRLVADLVSFDIVPEIVDPTPFF